MPAPSGDAGARVYSAWVTLPYRDARSAALGLRAELRHRLADTLDEVPDWDGFTLHGPTLSTDAHGHVWFEYTAVVACRPVAVAAAVPQR